MTREMALAHASSGCDCSVLLSSFVCESKLTLTHFKGEAIRLQRRILKEDLDSILDNQTILAS